MPRIIVSAQVVSEVLVVRSELKGQGRFGIWRACAEGCGGSDAAVGVDALSVVSLYESGGVRS